MLVKARIVTGTTIYDSALFLPGKAFAGATLCLGFMKATLSRLNLKGGGFVGVGQITARAKPIREVIDGKPLLNHELKCKNMADNAESNDLCEYVATVKWIEAVDREKAKWKARAGIYTTTHVRASLDGPGQPATVAFLQEAFGVDVREYLT